MEERDKPSKSNANSKIGNSSYCKVTFDFFQGRYYNIGMNKVWIITKGQYSDYQIVRVFSKKELAEEYAKRDYYCDIEEYPLDEPLPEAHFYIEMKKNGDVKTAHSTTDVAGFRYFNYGTPPNLEWVANTGDEQRAIKVVNEKRVQILALNIWGDDKKVREMVK